MFRRPLPIALAITLTTTLLILPALASAEVYRCERGGVVTFSDTPCDEQASRYRPADRVSIIGRPDDLEAITERNEAFVEQRLQRLAEQRRARAAASERQARDQSRADQRPIASPAPRLLPVYIDPPRRRHGHGKRHAAPEHEVERREPPFSALGGPFPGTRRAPDAPPRRNRYNEPNQ